MKGSARRLIISQRFFRQSLMERRESFAKNSIPPASPGIADLSCLCFIQKSANQPKDASADHPQGQQ
jgi:hypothetical protein